jgi:hypothetical protein
MEMVIQLHAPSALFPGEEPFGTYRFGGWLDPRAGLKPTEKKHTCLYRELNLALPARMPSCVDIIASQLKSLWKLFRAGELLTLSSSTANALRHAVVIWLRRCDIGRKVAGSNSNGFIEFFQFA